MSDTEKNSQSNNQEGSVGRPTVMTFEVLQKLELAFMMDYTDEEACFFAGISRATLYNYQKEVPEFLDRKNVLRRVLAMKSKAILSQALNPEMFIGPDGKPIMDYIKGNVELAMTYLQNKYPHEFGKLRANSSHLEEQIKKQVDDTDQLLRTFQSILAGADEQVQNAESGHGTGGAGEAAPESN